MVFTQRTNSVFVDADFVVIIDGGKIAAEGTPLKLKNEYSNDFLSIYGVSEEDVARLGYEFSRIPNGFKISLPNTRSATELISAHSDIFSDYEIVKGKMDDVFLAVTGKNLVGGDES